MLELDSYYEIKRETRIKVLKSTIMALRVPRKRLLRTIKRMTEEGSREGKKHESSTSSEVTKNGDW
jgi:hypothetical protein